MGWAAGMFADNGAHAESDGQKAGFGPFKAVDGKIRGTYGDHGEMALHSGWSWGNNLQQVPSVLYNLFMHVVLEARSLGPCIVPSHYAGNTYITQAPPDLMPLSASLYPCLLSLPIAPLS